MCTPSLLCTLRLSSHDVQVYLPHVDTAFVFDCLALPGLGTVPLDTSKASRLLKDSLRGLMSRSGMIKVMHDGREVRRPAGFGSCSMFHSCSILVPCVCELALPSCCLVALYPCSRGGLYFLVECSGWSIVLVRWSGRPGVPSTSACTPAPRMHACPHVSPAPTPRTGRGPAQPGAW